MIWGKSSSLTFLVTVVDANLLWLKKLQIKVPHPSFPSMRVSIQVPNLGMHFSPSRFQRLMKLLNILYGTLETVSQPAVDNFQAERAPWSPADLCTDARILVWKVWYVLILRKTSRFIFKYLVLVTLIFFIPGDRQFCGYMAALFSCVVGDKYICFGVREVSELSAILQVSSYNISICLEEIFQEALKQ